MFRIVAAIIFTVLAPPAFAAHQSIAATSATEARDTQTAGERVMGRAVLLKQLGRNEHRLYDQFWIGRLEIGVSGKRSVCRCRLGCGRRGMEAGSVAWT